MLKTKLWVFLKPGIILQQKVSKLCMQMEKNPSKSGIQKQSEEENIIKNIRNLLELKKYWSNKR